MKKPTPKQIKAEIARLTKMKPNVRHFSGFGDDHHAAIDAQIEVLTKRMDLDDVYATYPIREDGAGEESSANVCDAAVEACNWMEGESKEPAPSKGWQDLVKVAPKKK